MNVFLAGLSHETHCFTDDRTTIDAFRITRGDDLLRRAKDGSQIAGFLQVAEDEGWRVLPGIAYEGAPSGVVDHSVFESYWLDLAPLLTKALYKQLHGIFLSLHGAMVTTAQQDAEGELLGRIRSLLGAERVPVFGVFDLHANFSPRMAALSNGLLSYRENPHIDAYDCSREAALLLKRCLVTGVTPVMRVAQVPVAWVPGATATADSPMRYLELRARELERVTPGVLAINVVPGFCYSDVHDTGLSFSAIVEGETQWADQALFELADIAWKLRLEGVPIEHDLDTLLGRILPVESGPILLVEPADNIGGGAPGDCTDVLRALVRAKVADAGVVLADARAVELLWNCERGARCSIAIGGRGSRLDLGPVSLNVAFVSRSDGKFTLEDPHSHGAGGAGLQVDMGRSVVVQHDGITILLTSKKTPPWDLGQWRSQGIEPRRFKIIGIKAAVAHRQAYNGIAKASYTVRTRGPCATSLSMLPYKNSRRPVFPIDE
jgi:microcystin degradation protein MlrC